MNHLKKLLPGLVIAGALTASFAITAFAAPSMMTMRNHHSAGYGYCQIGTECEYYGECDWNETGVCDVDGHNHQENCVSNYGHRRGGCHR